MIDTIRVPGHGVELDALTISATDCSKPRTPILMIHENRGLVRYMQDVITELASRGHHVVAPDLLSRIGGTTAYAREPDEVSTRMIDSQLHVADLMAVYDWMRETHDTVAVLGFCFGAEMGWRLVTERPAERAALLYGIGPSPTSARSITSKVYAAYAEHDARVNDTLEPLCRALSTSHADVTLESFPGTRHAFHDHTRPDRFSAEPAEWMWQRVLEFLA